MTHSITYQAIPYPLPEAEQRSLRSLSANLTCLYTGENRTVPFQHHADHQLALHALNTYTDHLRKNLGVEVTRPEIRHGLEALA